MGSGRVGCGSTVRQSSWYRLYTASILSEKHADTADRPDLLVQILVLAKKLLDFIKLQKRELFNLRRSRSAFGVARIGLDQALLLTLAVWEMWIELKSPKSVARDFPSCLGSAQSLKRYTQVMQERLVPLAVPEETTGLGARDYPPNPRVLPSIGKLFLFC
jgi:hypothetical protein